MPPSSSTRGKIPINKFKATCGAVACKTSIFNKISTKSLLVDGVPVTGLEDGPTGPTGPIGPVGPVGPTGPEGLEGDLVATTYTSICSGQDHVHLAPDSTTSVSARFPNPPPMKAPVPLPPAVLLIPPPTKV